MSASIMQVKRNTSQDDREYCYVRIIRPDFLRDSVQYQLTYTASGVIVSDPYDDVPLLHATCGSPWPKTPFAIRYLAKDPDRRRKILVPLSPFAQGDCMVARYDDEESKVVLIQVINGENTPKKSQNMDSIEGLAGKPAKLPRGKTRGARKAVPA